MYKYLLALLLLGCGGVNNDSLGTSISSSDICSSDKTAQPWSAGMKQTGPNGFSVAITSDPPQPSPGDKAKWILFVTDHSGVPVVGAKVSVLCSMTHVGFSHGCPVTPTVTDLGKGMYQAYPVIFNMTGHWQVDVSVGTWDDIKFQLCAE